MAEKKTEKDSKVFDVAKPGDGKNDIGGKPMIIGHKSIKEDPMVKDAAEAPQKEAKEEAKVTPPSVSKKVIEPLSKEEKKEESPADDSKTEPEAEMNEAEQDEKGKTVDPEVEKNEKNDKLQKLVESKKYFVTVHENTASHAKVFTITFIVALLVGTATVLLLIDAEILDLGVDLPFDFL